MKGKWVCTGANPGGVEGAILGRWYSGNSTKQKCQELDKFKRLPSILYRTAREDKYRLVKIKKENAVKA